MRNTIFLSALPAEFSNASKEKDDSMGPLFKQRIMNLLSLYNNDVDVTSVESRNSDVSIMEYVRVTMGNEKL